MGQGQRLKPADGALGQGPDPGELEVCEGFADVCLSHAQLDPPLLEAFCKGLQLSRVCVCVVHAHGRVRGQWVVVRGHHSVHAVRVDGPVELRVGADRAGLCGHGQGWKRRGADGVEEVHGVHAGVDHLAVVGPAVGAGVPRAHAGVVGVHHVVLDVQPGPARGPVLANVHGEAVGPADQAIVEGREEIALEGNRTLLVRGMRLGNSLGNNTC